jgi:hypothetical protein
MPPQPSLSGRWVCRLCLGTPPAAATQLHSLSHSPSLSPSLTLPLSLSISLSLTHPDCRPSTEPPPSVCTQVSPEGDGCHGLPPHLAQRHGSCELKRLRSQLEATRDTVPLFDTARWVTHFEAGLRMLWELYVARMPAMHVLVHAHSPTPPQPPTASPPDHSEL